MKNTKLTFILISLSLCIACFMFACNHNKGGGQQAGETKQKTKLNMTVKVHSKKVEENKDVELSVRLGTVEETKHVEITFDKTDHPKPTIKGLPITLEAGKNFEFTITVPESEKYEAINRKITIKCVDATPATLQKITVHGIKVENNMVTIPLKHKTVTKNDVKIYFQESDASTNLQCTPDPLELKAGESKELKIKTQSSKDYKSYEATITVKREERKELTLKKFTIHHLNAISGSVTINEEKVEKGNVELEFVESGAQTEFSISPETLTLAYSESKKLTITVAESDMYRQKVIEVQVKRAKDPSAPKDIDDCEEALKGKLTWIDGNVDQDITLLTTVEGFENSTVAWKVLDQKHCEISGTTVKIKRDIVDIKVEFEATIEWNQTKKTVKYALTILKFNQITDNTVSSRKYTYDFSSNGMLLLKKNDHIIAKAKLKNIDVTKGEFLLQIVQVSKDGDGDELVDLDEMMDFNIAPLEVLFGAKYVALASSDNITWAVFKEYLVPIFDAKNVSDEALFNKIKVQLLSNYSGSLDDFNKLDAAQRTKMVKDGLELLKKSYCGAYGFPEDTPPENILNLLKEKLRAQNKAEIDKMKMERLFSYTLTPTSQHSSYPDGVIFTAKSVHDSTKAWYEQAGSYSSPKQEMPIINDVKYLGKKGETIIIEAHVLKEASSEAVTFEGELKDGTFDLKGKDANKTEVELKGSIADTKDGHITLTVASGYIDAKAYSLTFEGTAIAALMEWTLR